MSTNGRNDSQDQPRQEQATARAYVLNLLHFLLGQLEQCREIEEKTGIILEISVRLSSLMVKTITELGRLEAQGRCQRECTCSQLESCLRYRQE
jgi:hypothetical protein